MLYACPWCRTMKSCFIIRDGEILYDVWVWVYPCSTYSVIRYTIHISMFVIYVLSELTYCDECTTMYSIWSTYTWNDSVINQVTKEKYSIYHKSCKIQYRDLGYRVTDQRSQAFMQTIEIFGLIVFHDIIVSFFIHSHLAIWKKICFLLLWYVYYFLDLLLLYSLSCEAYSLPVICFSSYTEV